MGMFVSSHEWAVVSADDSAQALFPVGSAAGERGAGAPTAGGEFTPLRSIDRPDDRTRGADSVSSCTL